MKLIANWRAVVRRAWSVRLIAPAVVLTGLEAAFGFVGSSLPLPPRWTALIAFTLTASAFVARLVAQPSIGDEK